MRYVPVLVLLTLLPLVIAVYVFQHQRPTPGPTAPGLAAPLRVHAAGVTMGDFQAARRAGELVAGDGQPVPATAFPERGLTFIYFGADAHTPCRRFTARLIGFCQRAGPNPPFNVVMVDEDDSQAAIADAARSQRMPWPFVKRASAFAVRLTNAYAGAKVPDLVLVDADGRVLDDSFAGPTYRGAQAVLDDYQARNK